MKNCDQFRELIEAYALGALDHEERAALEAHLATGCQACAKAVEEARWLVSQLAYVAPEAAPSDMLKGRLMQTVRAEAQADAQAKPHVISTKPAIPLWLLAGVAALLIFSIYSAWNARRLHDEIRQADERAAQLFQERQKTEEQLAMAKREAMILMDPTSIKIPMAGSDKQGPQLEAKWHPQLGIVVMGDKIPMPAPHHVLQLWFIPKEKGAKPMPSMMTWPDANGKFVMVVSNPPESMDATKALAITEEPEGGSHWPTTTPIYVGPSPDANPSP
ncbi:MAG TPA: anti-sigma factor [Candidatus Acidoferrum sp.]